MFSGVDGTRDDKTVENVESLHGDDSGFRIPDVDEQCKPIIGMFFDSLEKAEKFYVNYAKVSGFSVRKSSTKYRNSDGAKELYLRDFVCSKEGYKNSSNTKRIRGHTRLGCKAKISFLKDGERWKVRNLVEGHSHVLCAPRKTHLLRSHREVTNAQKNLIGTSRGANVTTAQTMNSRGYEEVGCMERDTRSNMGKNRNEVKDYDTELFLNHFKEKAEMDPSYYFAYEVDGNNRLTHCFWAEGGARKAYAHFGDVVVFDTTFSTNKYSLFCAPFTGVNHHFQSINFGCGLLKDKKIDSFMWLFEKWLEAMGNSPPKAFITDQDPGTWAAIAQLFPHVAHRFCIWHIMKKLSEEVSPIAYRSDFFEPFKACVYGSKTSDEFEEKWWGLIRKFQLEHNEWLATMYYIRKKWIPLYFKNIFMAGMNSNHRIEVQNYVFDKYFNKDHSLIEFIHLFEGALERQRYNELVADHETFDKTPELATDYAIELQMAKRYTHKIFYMFQKEVLSSMQCGSMLKLSKDVQVHIVKRLGDLANFCEVSFNPSNKEIICSCKKFENEGIPCSHIIVVLRNNCIDCLPENLILGRWTTIAKSMTVHDDDGVKLQAQGTSGKSNGRKNIEIVRGFVECLNDAPVEVCNVAKDMLVDLQKMASHSAGGSNNSPHCRSTSVPSIVNVHPPSISKTEGSGKRLMGENEIAMEEMSKRRTCSVCGKKEKHNARTCPKLKEMLLQNTQADPIPFNETQASIID